ncbi:LysR family transcriptional regulator [Nocardioides aromaticivorans]|uniref:LysR family transcriptional regulator n=1 Tax=Nocardioides aromaticivorans TaxID=200618 RepID=A0ABX7PJD8_9ACTN|nr:LysR family transcriptional regulator [Nocardioides aromaticivorans]QSR25780.1 LysR family transcriptional regulator [Nocardioides aromaticivorans]
MLGPHVPDLRALELLVVVSRTGSLGAAAAELGITQQAASSRVRTMESLVGEPLVTRSKRGSELTPTGELVVQWADRVLDAAQELDAGIGALRADRRGHLDIAASLTIAEHLLPGWLVGLRAQQVQRGQQPTDITMTATNTQRVVELVTADEVTLGFVEGPDAPRGLRHRLVGTDELVVVVGPAHPWALRSRRRVTAATLAATPLVVREVGSGTRTVLERALADLPMAAPVLELSSTASVRAAVAAGAGPAAVGAHAVRDDLATGRLVRVTVTGLDLTRRLHAVWKGGPYPPEGPARELVAWASRR